jgi:hypothetical protein
MQPIGLLEQRQGLFEIIRLLRERFRIPFAPHGCAEVTAIDVDRTSESPDGIENGMDDMRKEGRPC